MSAPLILGTNSIKDTGYNVANSCRFDSSNDEHMHITYSGASNRKTWTWSGWVKRTKTGVQTNFWSVGSANNTFGIIYISSNDDFTFYEADSGGTTAFLSSSQLFRDNSAWYHILFSLDTTQSTANNRQRLWVNGTEVTSFGNRTNPSLNADLKINSAIKHYLGGTSTGLSNLEWDGYMAEVVFLDGTAVTDATNFGEFDEDSPTIWKPKDVSGLTFGTNGFYLDFENSGSLGADVSGNGNNFTVNNLTSIDQSTDTCTNNAVTFTATHPTASNFTISQGGLKINKSGAGTFGLYGSSIMLSSGKWYWEVKFTGDAGSDRTRAGIAHYDSVSGTSTIQDDYSGFEFTCTTSGRFSFTTVGGSATEINGFNGYSTGDIIRFALDMDNQRLYVGRNADWFNYSSSATGGDPTSGSGWLINDTTILKAPQTIYAGHAVGVSGSSELEFNFGATNTFTVSSGNSDANGYGNFEFAVPSGYYAINTKNLAEYG